jgi:hypothetical protein
MELKHEFEHLSTTGFANEKVPSRYQKRDTGIWIVDILFRKACRVHQIIAAPAFQRIWQDFLAKLQTANPRGHTDLDNLFKRPRILRIKQCADDTDESLHRKNLPAVMESQYHQNEIYRSAGTLLRHKMS